MGRFYLLRARSVLSLPSSLRLLDLLQKRNRDLCSCKVDLCHHMSQTRRTKRIRVLLRTWHSQVVDMLLQPSGAGSQARAELYLSRRRCHIHLVGVKESLD